MFVSLVNIVKNNISEAPSLCGLYKSCFRLLQFAACLRGQLRIIAYGFILNQHENVNFIMMSTSKLFYKSSKWNLVLLTSLASLTVFQSQIWCFSSAFIWDDLHSKWYFWFAWYVFLSYLPLLKTDIFLMLDVCAYSNSFSLFITDMCFWHL